MDSDHIGLHNLFIKEWASDCDSGATITFSEWLSRKELTGGKNWFRFQTGREWDKFSTVKSTTLPPAKDYPPIPGSRTTAYSDGRIKTVFKDGTVKWKEPKDKPLELETHIFYKAVDGKQVKHVTILPQKTVKNLSGINKLRLHDIETFITELISIANRKKFSFDPSFLPVSEDVFLKAIKRWERERIPTISKRNWHNLLIMDRALWSSGHRKLIFNTPGKGGSKKMDKLFFKKLGY